MRLVMVEYCVCWMAVFAEFVGVTGSDTTLFRDGVDGVMHHTLVAENLLLRRMMVTWSLMRMEEISNDETHPWLQSTLMDMNAPAGNCGNIYPLRASGGRKGRSRRHVCVDVMVFLSGMVTTIGLVVM